VFNCYGEDNSGGNGQGNRLNANTGPSMIIHSTDITSQTTTMMMIIILIIIIITIYYYYYYYYIL